MANAAGQDLLNLSSQSSDCLLQPIQKVTEATSSSTTNSNKTWYDIFADLDPLGNPDAIGDKEKENKEMENRYC